MKNGYSFKKSTTLNCIWNCLYPILIYFLASFVVGVVATIIMIPKYGTDTNLLTEKLNSNIMLVTIFAQIIGIAFVLPIYLSIRKYFPKVKEKVSLKYVLFSAISVIGVGVISGFFANLIDYFLSRGDLEQVNTMLMSGGILITFIPTVILAPIMEELMFRGIILNKLLSTTSKWPAILISSFLFGFIHLNLIQGLNAFVLGIILSLIFIKCRSIIPCILGHSLNNLLSIICSFITLNNNFVDTPTTIIIQVVCLVLSILPMYFFFKYKGVPLEKEEN